MMNLNNKSERKTYNINDVREYVEGWLMSDCNKSALSINEIVAMLNNALITIQDESDGIDSYLNRKQYYLEPPTNNYERRT